MIPFIDLKASYQSIKAGIDSAALGVLESAHYAQGPAVAAFEDAFAAYVGVNHAVAVNSGTSALHLALLAAGIGPGDEVITVPMTFVATVAAILYAGATPIFVDIDPVSWTMDPSALEAALSPRTKAIMPVHLHGQMADMELISMIARRHGLLVIEDAAQAHGASDRGQSAGAIGDIGCFSFYPGKNLGACGEGGAALTNSEELAGTMRILRDWGQDRKYNHALKGFNYRMDGLQGAILSVKLQHLESWTEARRVHAQSYDAALAHLPLQRPAGLPGKRHVYHVYAIATAKRDHARAVLTRSDIASGIHYPLPVHLQPAYQDLGYRRGDFPVAEDLAARTLSLPIYPEMAADAPARVAAALERALDQGDSLPRPEFVVAPMSDQSEVKRKVSS